MEAESKLESKKLFLNYLDTSKERVLFQTHASLVKDPSGAPIDPWEYQDYQSLVQRCLDAINQIYRYLVSTAKSFSSTTLVNAHFIDSLSLGTVSDQTIRARKVTKGAADQLNSGFETFSQRLDVLSRRAKYEKELPKKDLLKELEEFSQKWDEFDSQLAQDQIDALEYSNS